jgi:ferredoxin-NADP reductase
VDGEVNGVRGLTTPAGEHGQVLAMTVVSKQSAADGVVVVTVTAPDGARLPDWAPGAHVDLVLPVGITRQYSLCGDRWDTSRYRFAVLREPDGRGGSAYVHDVLQVGDVVGVGGPRNNFRLAPSPGYLFVAGGIGITPILPMVHQADLVDADWRLLYGGRRRASMAFLDELAAYGDKVSVLPQDERGQLPLQEWLGEPQDGVKVYCCGPAPLLDAAETLCAAWPSAALRTERFIAKEQPAPALSTPFDVVLARTGRTVSVPPGTSVLTAVRDAGVNVLSSCRQGTCGTCETTVLDGVPDHRDSVLSDHDRQAGDCMLVCVSRSRTERLVLDL